MMSHTLDIAMRQQLTPFKVDRPVPSGRHAPSSRAQSGAALVMGMIFLLVITLLVITVSGNASLQLRMAGNLRNVQQAQMSANTALRGAEWNIWRSTNVVGGQLICSDGSISAQGCVMFNPAKTSMYGASGLITQFREGATWPTTGIEYTGASGAGYTGAALDTAQLAKNPRYIIEDLGRVRPPGAGPQQESGAGSGAGGSIRVNTYRITARAAGGNDNAIRVLESTFDAQTKN